MDWGQGKCPACGNRVYALEGKKAPCPFCGEPIDAEAITIGNPWISGTCPYCGEGVYALEGKRIPCPHCGEPINAEDVSDSNLWKSGKCPSCGERVYLPEGKKAACPFCDEPIDSQTLMDRNPWIRGWCPHCGERVCALEDKKIPCPHCGEPIDAESLAQKGSARSPKPKSDGRFRDDEAVMSTPKKGEEQKEEQPPKKKKKKKKKKAKDPNNIGELDSKPGSLAPSNETRHEPGKGRVIGTFFLCWFITGAVCAITVLIGASMMRWTLTSRLPTGGLIGLIIGIVAAAKYYKDGKLGAAAEFSVLAGIVLGIASMIISPIIWSLMQ